ncbi:hypothetical protein ACIQXD_23155 [Streptomyces uncialis]|uniref:hypothetical protein n=1 Tax=Streptomyces uncialis TaxID=1048205 RepID=UPI003804B322
MHDPYEITTLNPHPAPGHGPRHDAVIVPADLPPGVQLVTLPGGIRTLAYTQPTTPATHPAPPVRPIPTWARTTALLTPTIGGGIAAAGAGLSYAAPGLIAMTHALWATAALIAAGTIAVPVIRGTTRRRTTAPAHITQHVTATGMFGRANGTINHH